MAVWHRLGVALERRFPERRVFLRSDTDTRFLILSPASQAIGLAGAGLVVLWAILATSFLLMQTLGSGTLRQQAARDRALYEQRLNSLSAARDLRAAEAAMALDRFLKALEQISAMQTALLAAEDRLRDQERGIEAVQATLADLVDERDRARGEVATLAAKLAGEGLDGDPRQTIASYEATVDTLAAELNDLAEARDEIARAAAEAEARAEALVHEAKLAAERTDRIFTQLEEAVSISLTPLDKMFEAAGMPTERILETVRQGYSGQGGPLTPIVLSTKGAEPDAAELRANGILDKLDRMNLYRIAASKAPFDMPVKSAFRFTSGFGYRWGRTHEGLDLAGAYGTPVYATADGIVLHADWQSGYGRLIKIQHEFGIETRYAHLSQIRVTKGQRVSRGERIGDMGNSGRSTGTHLHYEVRIGGRAVNPMTYIKAGNDVF